MCALQALLHWRKAWHKGNAQGRNGDKEWRRCGGRVQNAKARAGPFRWPGVSTALRAETQAGGLHRTKGSTSHGGNEAKGEACVTDDDGSISQPLLTCGSLSRFRLSSRLVCRLIAAVQRARSLSAALSILPLSRILLWCSSASSAVLRPGNVTARTAQPRLHFMQTATGGLRCIWRRERATSRPSERLWRAASMSTATEPTRCRFQTLKRVQARKAYPKAEDTHWLASDPSPSPPGLLGHAYCCRTWPCGHCHAAAAERRCARPCRCGTWSHVSNRCSFPLGPPHSPPALPVEWVHATSHGRAEEPSCCGAAAS